LKAGDGTFDLGSGALSGTYSFSSRFEDGSGTNPEELIGAAQAACFSMALAGNLGGAGYQPATVNTAAEVHIDKTDAGWTITQIDLRTEANVPGVSNDEFQQLAETTRTTCPVARALGAVTLTLEAKLAG